MPETFAIRAERGIIVDAARHIGPMSGHHLAVGDLLEIEDVESLGRVSNELGSTLREEGRDSTQHRYIGTRGQKLDKFAAGFDSVWVHDGL